MSSNIITTKTTKPINSKARNNKPRRNRQPNNRNRNASTVVNNRIVYQQPRAPRTRRTIAQQIACAEQVPRTDAGIDMIKIVQNPCGEEPVSNYEGIVDGPGQDRIQLKLRDDLILDPPPNIDEEELVTFVVFNTPYFMVHYIILRYFGPGPTQADLIGVANAITANQQDTVARYPNWFTPVQTVTAVGELTTYVGPPFDITFVVPASLSTFTSSQTATSPSWTWFRKWRYAAKGATMHLNAPAVQNQGRSITAATSTESAIKNISITGSSLNTAVHAARFTVTPPFADNILAMQDTNSHQDLAKKGEYTIQRHANETIVWNEAEDVRPIWRVSSAINNAATVISIPSVNHLKVDGFDMNMGWIVSHVRGVSQQAALHLKLRSYIEATVPGTSPWAPFMCPPPPKDAPALNLNRELSALLPHAFVSDYNDWGLLSNIIKRAIGRITAPLARTAIHAGYDALMGLTNKLETEITPNESRGGYGNRAFNN